MFAATELLMPMGTTADTDWRAHYFKVRRWFYAMMIVFTLLATIETRVLLDVPLTHTHRITHPSTLALQARRSHHSQPTISSPGSRG